MIIFWGIGIWATVWLIRSLVAPKEKSGESSALKILDERFAKGEINKKDYLSMKDSLSS